MASMRKRRIAGLLFAVGMVVYANSSRQDVTQFGVIFEWDPYCVDEKYWKERSGPLNLKEQFYSLIYSDGTIDYVPQSKIFKYLSKKKKQ